MISQAQRPSWMFPKCSLNIAIHSLEADIIIHLPDGRWAAVPIELLGILCYDVIKSKKECLC